MSLSIILYMANRNNIIVHFHDDELMDPKNCAPFFRMEQTDFAASREFIERNYPKKLTFNEAVKLQNKIAYLQFHAILSAINWNEWNW